MRRLCTVLLLISLTSCLPKREPLTPELSYTLYPRKVQRLPAPFPAPSPSVVSEDWGKELKIGNTFGRQGEYYRAITAYKRGLILSPTDEGPSQLQMHYGIALAYYLGLHYADAFANIINTPLIDVSSDFPPYENLLLILYDSARNTELPARADTYLSLITQASPSLADKLKLGSAIETADFKALSEYSQSNSEVADFLETFRLSRKSPGKTRLQQALLPGMGYWYIGQRNSAVTSLLVNGLFIWASYRLFDEGHTALGILTTSLEVGWYLGGIYGSGRAAEEYNQALYEQLAQPVMVQQKLYPVLQLKYGF